jgi:hypothetical protein
MKAVSLQDAYNEACRIIGDQAVKLELYEKLLQQQEQTAKPEPPEETP